MLEFPKAMRDLLVENLDEYCEGMDDTSDSDAVSEAVVELIENVAQEVSGVAAEEVLGQLESSGELEASIVEVLEDTFASDSGFIYTGEEIVVLLEKLCEIEWLDGTDEEDGAGFFGDDVEASDYD